MPMSSFILRWAKETRALCTGFVATTFAVLGLASSASATVTTIDLEDGADPIRIAIDDAGYAYTANFARSTVSRIRLGDGSVDDGWAPTGRSPFALAIDPAGNVYTSNGASNNVTKITPGGASSGSALDDYEWAPTGEEPYGIAVGPGGYVYVANKLDDTVTRIAPDGSSSGTPPGYVWARTGNFPYNLALNSSGDLFVTTSSGLTRITADGTPSGTAPQYQWAPTGSAPLPVVLDWEENVYTANWTPPGLTRVTPAGVPSGSAPAYQWAPLPEGGFPEAMVIDSLGNLYVANSDLSTVTKIEPDGTTEPLAVTGDISTGIALDSSGNLYTANYGDSTVTKISPGGGTPDIAPAPPAVPSAPTAVAGNGKATVTVPVNPSSSRYGAPSSYSVAAVEDSSKGCVVTPPATFCEVTGLTNGTAYSFTAQATLNAWRTAASFASDSVTPLVPPTRLSVSSVKSRVTRTSVLITSQVKVSGRGKIAQRATTGKGKKRKTWCRASRRAGAATTYTVKCKIGNKGRKALRKRPLKLTLRTTFTPTAGKAVTRDRKLTLKRKG